MTTQYGICQNCNHVFQSESRFCPECGDNRFIPCPTCNVEVLKGMKFCSNCGSDFNVTQNLIEESALELPCPGFPSNLDIGGQFVNWTGNSNVKANHVESSGIFKHGQCNMIEMCVHKHGLKLYSEGILKGTFSGDVYAVHISQLIDIRYEHKDSIVTSIEKNKSIIGRALLGTIIAGPAWGIIGGMTGFGKKEVKVSSDTDYLVIIFWDIKTKTPKIVILSGKFMKSKFEKIINKVKSIQN